MDKEKFLETIGVYFAINHENEWQISRELDYMKIKDERTDLIHMILACVIIIFTLINTIQNEIIQIFSTTISTVCGSAIMLMVRKYKRTNSTEKMSEGLEIVNLTRLTLNDIKYYMRITPENMQSAYEEIKNRTEKISKLNFYISNKVKKEYDDYCKENNIVRSDVHLMKKIQNGDIKQNSAEKVEIAAVQLQSLPQTLTPILQPQTSSHTFPNLQTPVLNRTSSSTFKMDFGINRLNEV
jgi:hypothetical protein